MEPEGIVEHLPSQWLGMATLIIVVLYILGQLIERFEAIAKFFPFLGKWWHNRKRPDTIGATDVAKAVEQARDKWEQEGNEALKAIESKIESISRLAIQQTGEIAALNNTVRAFAAWSAYDSRWHHRHEVENSAVEAHVSAQHLDFFQYEKLYNDDPLAAALLLR